ncbi:MAG: pilus assembly protein TadG-related protein, partial [Nocardioides sp.]
MKRFLRLRRKGDEAGYVAIMISIMVPTLFIGLAAVGVDTARWYVEGENVQIAADAAALAGVPFLPQDLPGARTRALQVAARNGYVPGPDVTIVVEKGIRDSQLRVTINSTIPNQFGGAIGVDSATIGRTAVADFTGPAPMGSPCNTFGTEPASGTGAAAPAGSAIGASRPPNCPQEPQMWATLEGPQTGKVQGDRYGTANCESTGVDGCDASRKNLEYLEEGYFFLIKVQAGAVNRPISLQLYDPAFVNTGQFCAALPDWKASPGNNDLKDNMNPYATTDGRLRYSDQSTVPSASRPGLGGRPSFCPGDSYPGSATGGTNKLTTTFMVREQTDSQDPLQAAVVNSTAGTPCAKQFGSYTSTPTVTSL